jgi:hypothetical protein
MADFFSIMELIQGNPSLMQILDSIKKQKEVGQTPLPH